MKAKIMGIISDLIPFVYVDDTNYPLKKRRFDFLMFLIIFLFSIAVPMFLIAMLIYCLRLLWIDIADAFVYICFIILFALSFFSFSFLCNYYRKRDLSFEKYE